MASTAGSQSGASDAEKRTKNFPRFEPRNPLKTLDSDERIQGNPRQSNPHQQGSSQRNGQGPRKPKRIDRTDGAAFRCREGAKPTPPKCKASWSPVRTSCFGYIMPHL